MLFCKINHSFSLPVTFQWFNCSSLMILRTTAFVLEMKRLPCVCSVSQSLFVTPMDCHPPGSSVPGIIPGRTPEWVAVSFSRGSSWPRGPTSISYISRQILYHWATWEDLKKWTYRETIASFTWQVCRTEWDLLFGSCSWDSSTQDSLESRIRMIEKPTS